MIIRRLVRVRRGPQWVLVRHDWCAECLGHVHEPDACFAGRIQVTYLPAGAAPEEALAAGRTGARNHPPAHRWAIFGKPAAGT